MFSDPITLTIGGASKSLARVSVDESEAKYRLVESVSGSNVEYELILSHDFKNRYKANVRLTKRSLVADPLATGQNRQVEQAVNLSFNWDALLPIADPVNLALAVSLLLYAGTGQSTTNATRVATGEV